MDIYEKEWLDVVFSSRNQSYGAYELRRLSTVATNKALFIVTLVVALLVFGKFAYDNVPKTTQSVTQAVLEPVTLDHLVEEEPEKIEEPLPPIEAPAQQIAQDPPAIDLIRHVEPKVVEASRVTEDVASQDDLKDKMSARITLKKSAGGSLIARGEFGPKKVEGAITGNLVGDVNGDGSGSNEPFISVEVMPAPKEGMPAFVKWVANSYNYPQGALDQGVKGIVQVSFVVETDGSLTDFKVIRDIGFGTGDEAIRLLKKAPKWDAGIQNGVPVRVRFTLPINLSTI